MPVLVVLDPDPLFRNAVCGYLREAGREFEIVERDSVETFEAFARTHPVDVLLAADEMIQALQEPLSCKVVVLGDAGHDGATPGLPRTAPARTILETARRSLVKQTTAKQNPEDFGLGAQEALVLSRLSKGMADKAIAHELSIPLSTVKKQVRSVFRKLGVANRVQAALFAQGAIEF